MAKKTDWRFLVILKASCLCGTAHSPAITDSQPQEDGILSFIHCHFAQLLGQCSQCAFAE